MSAFEFFFTFYGLIMGLAVANAAGGFGAMWRDRHDLRVGWCVPLLCAQILLSSVAVWLAAWSGAEAQVINQIELLGALGVTVPYVFISVAMFPRDAGKQTSLDDHYLSHSRSLIGALMVSRLTALLLNISYGFWPGPFELAAIVLPQWTVLIVLFFWRNLRAHQIGLALLAAHVLWRVAIWSPS